MAFKTIAKSEPAVALDKKGATIQGYLMAAKTGLGKFKNSSIYTLQTDAGPTRVFGNMTADSVLLDEKKKSINPELSGVMVRITCIATRQVKEGKKVKTYKDIQVDVDLADKLRQSGNGKRDYVLRSAK